MTRNLLNEIKRSAKNATVKRQIIRHLLMNNSLTISDLAKELNLSVPTVTKFIDEMCDAGYLVECGKLETSGGRHPSLYGLKDDYCYFLGVELKRTSLSIGLVDFQGRIINVKNDIPFKLVEELSVLDEICKIVNKFIEELNIDKSKILNACFGIPGRINPQTGVSYSLLNFNNSSLNELLSQRLGINVITENDSRAMAYGEYMMMDKKPRSMIFINISWGLGMAFIADGKLYEGYSGFAGEFGHNPGYDNEYICHCGKKGCIETEVSCMALHRNFVNSLKEGKNSIVLSNEKRVDSLTLKDIFSAIEKEDVLAIELVEKIGTELGRHVGGLINIFNPELVVIGGDLSKVGDCLLHPVLTAIRKFTLSLMYKDSDVVLSSLKDRANVMGACLIARSKMFE